MFTAEWVYMYKYHTEKIMQEYSNQDRSQL